MNDDAIGELDFHLFNEGQHSRAYEKLGAHILPGPGPARTRFAVWAPNAKRVGVIGDFNDWSDPYWLSAQGSSGIWAGVVSGVGHGALYKYRIESSSGAQVPDKSDPFARYCEEPPKTASVVWQCDYEWQDADWLSRRGVAHALGAPISIYEVHLGSWMRGTDGSALSYRELAPRLAQHVLDTGFTHIELMPMMEHPFYGSWGYQVTGHFAPTSRYGAPEDFMYFVDYMHQRGIGVLLDWVPAHFPTDAHSLANFDGTHLYEHADPRQGLHAEWGSAVYNFGRHEVRSFLLSSANFWLDVYHIDGLRVDAVASMLYLDYGRSNGDWIPNRYGGNENLEAVEFIKNCNYELYSQHPDILTIAEESTAWPGVSRPVYTGGLGFGLKWDMGWMHDTLAYFSHDPVHRSYHHNQLTFRGMYAFSENFVLALSHDEVVHGKRSLLNKMPGDDWQRFANLRLLYAQMWSQPGKKLLFMGGEFGQPNEWNHDSQLDWQLPQGNTPHARLQLLVGELNRLYREIPALHLGDAHPDSFEWVDANDSLHSVFSYLRKGLDDRPVLVVLNATPVVRTNHRIGVDRAGIWEEVLNTDAEAFGGSGQGNSGAVEANPVKAHGRPYSLNLTLPPLGALYLRPR